MKISTKEMEQARIVAGHVPPDATICALVVDVIPPGALVQFFDGSYAVFRAGWPKHCDQAIAHKAMDQSKVASNPRVVTEARREQLKSQLEKARAKRMSKNKKDAES